MILDIHSLVINSMLYGDSFSYFLYFVIVYFIIGTIHIFVKTYKGYLKENLNEKFVYKVKTSLPDHLQYTNIHL